MGTRIMLCKATVSSSTAPSEGEDGVVRHGNLASASAHCENE